MTSPKSSVSSWSGLICLTTQSGIFTWSEAAMGRQVALTVRTRGSGFFLILKINLNLFWPLQQGVKLTDSDSLNHNDKLLSEMFFHFNFWMFMSSWPGFGLNDTRKRLQLEAGLLVITEEGRLQDGEVVSFLLTVHQINKLLCFVTCKRTDPYKHTYVHVCVHMHKHHICCRRVIQHRRRSVRYCGFIWWNKNCM